MNSIRSVYNRLKKSLNEVGNHQAIFKTLDDVYPTPPIVKNCVRPCNSGKFS